MTKTCPSSSLHSSSPIPEKAISKLQSRSVSSKEQSSRFIIFLDSASVSNSIYSIFKNWNTWSIDNFRIHRLKAFFTILLPCLLFIFNRRVYDVDNFLIILFGLKRSISIISQTNTSDNSRYHLLGHQCVRLFHQNFFQ